MIQQTTIATLIEWLRGFDQNAVVIDHGLYVMPHKEPFDFSKIWERILEYIPHVTVSFPHRRR